MIWERVVSKHPNAIILIRMVEVILLILLIGGGIYLCAYFSIICLNIDGCGPYHHSASIADLDGDGNPDILLSGLRHESDTIFWAGSILWTNQGGGVFTPHRVDYGGQSAAVGDMDGDGDPDVVRLDYIATLFINQGGEQAGKTGEFRLGSLIADKGNQHNWSAPGWVVVGDLNNDERVDVLASYCCSNVIDTNAGGADVHQFLLVEWINGEDSRNLSLLGDLPMRPTLGDLDGDGDLDIFAASLPPKGGGYDPADRVLLNDGSGNFTDSGQRLENPRLEGTAGSGSVTLGDLDGDGDLDALVATAAGAAVWTNQGGAQGGQAGLFVDSATRLDRGPIEDVFLADLDEDGDLDALAAEKAQASVWWNDGQAGFHDSGQRLKFTERHGLAVGDFNADGFPDVFAGDNEESHLWLNQGDGRLVKAE